MAYRLARSLDRLRAQINHQWPKRRKASDGWIGDAAHATTNSDHNPWIKDGNVGIVTALDVTHDPGAGVDTYAMAELMRTTRDPRVKYVISNSRIFSATVQPWTWRRYTGSNPHATHIHVSVVTAKVHYDAPHDWAFNAGAHNPPLPNNPDDPGIRRALKMGDRGEDVRLVQRLLVVSPDGVFGPITDAAVRKFQGREQLRQDGIVGKLTWTALDTIEQLPVPLNYDEPHVLSEPLT